MPSSFKNLTINDTGYIGLPSGTKAQRPSLTDSINTFTTVGTTSWTCPAGVTEVEVLVVAGGGAGGSEHSGGGGAGGVIYKPKFPVEPGTSYTITVGAGGTANIANSGNSGGNSVFGPLTAIGGGAGGRSDNQQAATSGGSGGGASYNGVGEAGTPGQGFNGGDGKFQLPYVGGGGGGAGGPGTRGEDDRAGAGGPGVCIAITGTPVWYGGGGGGGTGNNRSINGYGGAGGKGGGGNGGNMIANNTGASGENGAANTGGGGGGSSSNVFGGAGGSGIVVVRYSRNDESVDPNGQIRYNTEAQKIDIISKNKIKANVAEGVVTNGLQLYLDPYNSDGSDWFDASGNDLGLTLSNGPTVSNGIITFDNSDTQLASRGNTSLLNQEGPLTVSVWYRTTVTDRQYIVAQGDGTDYGCNYQLFIDTQHSFSIGYGSSAIYAATPNTVVTGKWTNFVGVFDGTQLKSYINGELSTVTDWDSAQTQYTTSGTFRVGDRNTSGVNFEGDIGILSFYDRALSTSEIKQNFKATAPRYLSSDVVNDTSKSVIKEGLVVSFDPSNDRCMPRIGSSERSYWYDLAYGNRGQILGGGSGTRAQLDEHDRWFSLDGSNDAVVLYDTSMIDTANCSITGWIYLANYSASAAGNNQRIIHIYDGSNDLQLIAQESGVYFVWGSTTRGNGLSYSSQPSTNSWIHFGVTYEMGVPHSVYLDAVCVASSSSAPGNPSPTIKGIVFGANIGGSSVSNGFCTGRLGDVQIYNRRLLPSEIWHNREVTKRKYGK